MTEREFIPYCGIYPGKLTFYSLPESPLPRSGAQQSSAIWNLAHNSTCGILSDKSEKKIKLAIDWLLFLAADKKVFSKKSGQWFKFKINFVTLTLSSTQLHSDIEIKEKLLSQFLVECKFYHNVVNYLWRAEVQRNGNIHFHLVTDKFIPWLWIQTTWNRIQNKLGYIDRFAVKMRKKFENGFVYDHNDKYKRSYSTQLKAYKKGNSEDWYKPNSTDVHSIKNIRNISRYLAKYCTKNPDNSESFEVINNSDGYYKKAESGYVRTIEGTLWNLSNSLSKYKKAIVIAAGYVTEELDEIIKVFNNKMEYYDYTSVCYVNVSKWEKFGQKYLFPEFLNYANSV